MIYFICKLCLMCYNPYQTIADFFKTTTTGFFYLLKILYIANIVFFISKNLLRALKQTKTCSKPPIIQIGLLWPLGFYQKTKKRWNRLKQNLIHVENWTGLSRQLEKVKCQVRRCRLSQFRFRSPCGRGMTGIIFCSACSLDEPLAIM